MRVGGRAAAARRQTQGRGRKEGERRALSSDSRLVGFSELGVVLGLQELELLLQPAHLRVHGARATAGSVLGVVAA